MTAELVLAGLYPPTKEDIWFKNLLWQPIPVHTMQTDNDNLIQMEASCPKYDTLLEKITKMPEFEEVKQRYSDMFKTIAENTGWTNVDIETVKSLFCTMYVYSKHNPSYIPEWYTKLNQKSLKNIAGLAFAIPTYTKEMQRLRTGPFFNYLINHLDGAVKGEKQKFLAISGHDSTIASVLSTLNCYSFEPPEFTATVFWEVYKTNSGDHYVNLLYKKNSESEAELIQLDNCKSNATLDELIAVLSPILTSEEQWRHDCFDSTSAAGSRIIDSRFLIITVIVLYVNKYL
ncbi:unnamed protein product [Callosobruchus maculatus]|nr:unnamed protein product [Callosobruchus maculatus]